MRSRSAGGRIRIVTESTPNGCRIQITDNGGGFPEDVIAEINEPDSPLYAQNHVGINNVKKRLQLIYGDRALYAFFNRDMGERMAVYLKF